MRDSKNTVRLTQAHDAVSPGKDFAWFKLFVDKPVNQHAHLAKNPKIGQRLYVHKCEKTDQNDYEITVEVISNDPTDFFIGSLELNKQFFVIE